MVAADLIGQEKIWLYKNNRIRDTVLE